MEPFDAELREISLAAHYALEAGRATRIETVRIFTESQDALKRLRSQEIGPGLAVANDDHAHYWKPRKRTWR